MSNAPTTRTGRGPLDEDSAFGGAFDEHLAAMSAIASHAVKVEIGGIEFREGEYAIHRDGRECRVMADLVVVEFDDGAIGIIGLQNLAVRMTENEFEERLERLAFEEEMKQEAIKEALDGRR